MNYLILFLPKAYYILFFIIVKAQCFRGIGIIIYCFFKMASRFFST